MTKQEATNKSQTAEILRHQKPGKCKALPCILRKKNIKRLEIPSKHKHFESHLSLIFTKTVFFTHIKTQITNDKKNIYYFFL